MIELYSSSSNLGDNLGCTALAIQRPCRVHMYDDENSRNIAPIFDDICDVVFDNGSPSTHAPISNDPRHLFYPTTQRHLYALGMFNLPALPVVKLKEEEFTKAEELVRQYKNPCIIKCSPQVTDNRTPPFELFKSIVKKNPDISFLTFGLSSSHSKKNTVNLAPFGVHFFYDLSIREQAAIYSVVGRYIGPDTGDYHLMLAVGGLTDVLVPENKRPYLYDYFHYNKDCWHGQPIRARYFNWEQPLGPFITGLNI